KICKALDRVPLTVELTRRRKSELAENYQPTAVSFCPVASLQRFVGRLGQELQALLFFSSQIIGSHNSTLFPSGSMIHANLPFSCDSGPPTISIPPALSCAIISSRLSTL